MAEYPDFIALHEPQLKMSGIPEHFWPVLHRKLVNQTLDAGDKFVICRVDYGVEEVEGYAPPFAAYSTSNIDSSDSVNVFLVDHAWTFSATEAKQHLRSVPGLLDRMATMMSCDTGVTKDEKIEAVFDRMWMYCQSYSLGSGASVEDRMPVWYIMDEFGSAIQHSSDPNFRAVPLLHIPEQVTYTVLFPIKSVGPEEEVTRNFIEGCLSEDEDQKNALLLPWFPSDFSGLNFEQDEPDKQYFVDGHIEETLPNLNALAAAPKKRKSIYKVFAEYRFIHDYLDHPQFEMTLDPSEADILWYSSHFKTFENLSLSKPSAFINQFPFEHVITIKDLLPIVSRRKLSKGIKSFNPETFETHPLWLPTTYNLKTELTKFVSYFQNREAKGLDNHWICKPYNLARGLDTHITDNLKYITRLPFSGPKIAQKYIENPVLFDHPDGCGKVKFDIRYVILLKSVEPLKAYAYRNFFLRFANKPFGLTDFDVYEKHFTVMNYSEAPLCRLLCDEYVKSFESQYPTFKWKHVEKDIFSMLLEVLECATFKPAPQGIAHSPQSRALYAADIMLEWHKNSEGEQKMQPKLLEINWMPDCQRACEYYPQFYNDVFSLLFLDKMNDEVFAEL